MNNHGGYLPNQGAVLPFDPSGRLPAHTGLTDVAFGGRPVRFPVRHQEIWRSSQMVVLITVSPSLLLAAIVTR